MCSQLGNEILTLHVDEGDKMATFRIHKKILCDKIPYFDKMFNSQFKMIGGINSSCNLPSYPLAFQLMISWIYEGPVEDPKPANALTDSGLTEAVQLLSLYVLAKKIAAVQLADETMDLAINFWKFRGCLPIQNAMVNYYHKVSENSKLRVFMSRVCAYVITATPSVSPENPWSNEKVHEAFQESPDLMLDTKALMRTISERLPHPQDSPICDYHHYGKNESCPYIKKK